LEKKEEKVLKISKAVTMVHCYFCGLDLEDPYEVDLGDGKKVLICDTCKNCLKILSELGFLKVKEEE
jgi:hypothetical protein